MEVPCFPSIWVTEKRRRNSKLLYKYKVSFLVYNCYLFDARTFEVNRFKLYPVVHVGVQTHTKRQTAFQESILYLRSITKWLTLYETAQYQLFFCPVSHRQHNRMWNWPLTLTLANMYGNNCFWSNMQTLRCNSHGIRNLLKFFFFNYVIKFHAFCLSV